MNILLSILFFVMTVISIFMGITLDGAASIIWFVQAPVWLVSAIGRIYLATKYE